MEQDRKARRHEGRPAMRPLALLLGGIAALLLGGCQATREAVSNPADSARSAGGVFGRPWDGEPPAMLASSQTVARVMGPPGAGYPPETLQTEAGNVWPGPLPPRATLANPDAALRGIPDYEPAISRRDPSAEAVPRSGPPRRGLPRGTAGLPPPLPELPETPRSPLAAPPASIFPERPPPRADGQVIHTPSGPVVTSGGTDRVQSFNVPGGGTGTAIRDGNTTTLIGPDGRVQTVPTPSR